MVESQNNPQLEIYREGMWFSPFLNYEERRLSILDDGRSRLRLFPFQILGRGSVLGIIQVSDEIIDREGVLLTSVQAQTFNKNSYRNL